MADPCVADTIYIDLETTGTPSVLSATLRNPEETFSATQGDDTTHDVTDHNVVHTLTQTVTVDNSAGSAPCRGIVVVAVNPIWTGNPDQAGCSLIWNAKLFIDGVQVDERDTITQELAVSEVITFSPGSLVGQLDIPAGDTVDVRWDVTIENDGASCQWSFRFGGSKLVAQMGY